MKISDPLLEDGGDGYSITYQSTRLYAKRRPKESAERRARTIEIADNTLVFVPSPLLFYGMDELLMRTGSNVFFLCVEYDERLMAISSEYADDTLLNHERVLYLRTDDPYVALSALLSHGGWTYRAVTQVILSGGYKLHRGFYDAVSQLLSRENQQQWQNRLTLTRMARMWMRNVFQNTATFELRSLPANPPYTCPAVVVGAGPSLEHALGWLQNHRSRVLLICVDTAFGTLSDAGYMPDILVILEGQIANYADFISDDRKRILEEVSVLADISSSSAVLRMLGASPFFFRSTFFRSAVFDRIDAEAAAGIREVPPMGSVGTVAVFLAKMITSGPVLLSGLDFSYEIGKSHASGSPSHKGLLARQERISPAESASLAHVARNPLSAVGRSGETVRTDMVLQSYSHAICDIASMYSEVYDTNPASILDGVPVLDAQQIDTLLRSHVTRHTRPVTLSPPVPEHPASSTNMTRRRLFESELAYIEEALKLCVDILDTKNFDACKRDWFEVVDYLYLDFPDYLTIDFTDPGVISRIAASALFYRGVIEKSIGMLSE